MEAADQHGMPAWTLATKQGHTRTLHAIAGTHSANVEAGHESGQCALMGAADEGRMDISIALAGTRNANVDADDANRRTTLILDGDAGTGTALQPAVGASTAKDNST